LVHRLPLIVALLAGPVVLNGCADQEQPVMLAPGDAAPKLTAGAHDGRIVDIGKLRGRTLVVYFYPRDGTPGCTTQACAFRDVWEEFEDAGIEIIGVSPDDVESHQQFAREHDIPFPLISDTKGEWAQAFGVDRTLGLPDRDSFLIAPDGTVAKVYRGVDPGLHAKNVLSDAADL
jgi:peroxiredoxin Q/BCP